MQGDAGRLAAFDPDGAAPLLLSAGRAATLKLVNQREAATPDAPVLVERAPWLDFDTATALSDPQLDLATPLNFVLTADIIGGNSGSPVVNAKDELTGIIFDGNLQSLAWDVVFDERQGRAMAVDVRAIVEALRKVYDASGLADELTRE